MMPKYSKRKRACQRTAMRVCLIQFSHTHDLRTFTFGSTEFTVYSSSVWQKCVDMHSSIGQYLTAMQFIPFYSFIDQLVQIYWRPWLRVSLRDREPPSYLSRWIVASGIDHVMMALTLNPNPESETSMHYEKSEKTPSSIIIGEKIIVMKNAGVEPRTSASSVQRSSEAPRSDVDRWRVSCSISVYQLMHIHYMMNIHYTSCIFI